MAKYDPDEFFSAERYPLPMKCSECGKTMRPVHKHCTPDMPRTYFCTFCGAGFYEDNPGIRFNKRQTNAERIRKMTDKELAEFLWSIGQNPGGWNYINGKPIFHTGDGNGWLDWLKQEVSDAN